MNSCILHRIHRLWTRVRQPSVRKRLQLGESESLRVDVLKSRVKSSPRTALPAQCYFFFLLIRNTCWILSFISNDIFFFSKCRG